MKRIKREAKIGILFLSASLIGTSVFYLVPYLDIFRRSFFTTASGELVGFGNYREIFGNQAFLLAMKNTLSFVAICIPLLLALSLMIALFLYRNPRQGNWMKTGFLVPMAIPVASIVLLWRLIFAKNGFLNGILQVFGVESVDWMNTDFAFWVLVASYIWKNLGYNVILWIAGLSTISADLYEAAELDGAGPWQCFGRITLPNLQPSMFIISALALLIGGLYLIYRKVISPVTPVSFILTVAVFALLAGQDPIFHVCAGGVMLGAFFMATDYATTPITPMGKIIFGIGCGLITMLIRVFGAYPEGVSFSILLMNILTPHIDNFCIKRLYGGGKKV